jgi:hypothetical protein
MRHTQRYVQDVQPVLVPLSQRVELVLSACQDNLKQQLTTLQHAQPQILLADCWDFSV